MKKKLVLILSIAILFVSIAIVSLQAAEPNREDVTVKSRNLHHFNYFGLF